MPLYTHAHTHIHAHMHTLRSLNSNLCLHQFFHLEMSSLLPLSPSSRLSSSLTSCREISWSQPVRPPLTWLELLFNAYIIKFPIISLPSPMAPGHRPYAVLHCFFHSTQPTTTHTAQQHATNICQIKRIKEWK